MVTVTVTYETVDVDLEVTTTEVTVEVFAHGEQGKSAYQSYLDTTTDDPPMTEEEWAAGGTGELSDIATTGFTAGRMLRIKSGGGMEERTPAQVLSDIGAAASGHTHVSADVTDATDTGTLVLPGTEKVAKWSSLGGLSGSSFKASVFPNNIELGPLSIVATTLSGTQTLVFTPGIGGYTVTVPGKTGTVAMTSDIPTQASDIGAVAATSGTATSITLNTGVTWNATSITFGTGAADAFLTAVGGGATGVALFKAATVNDVRIAMGGHKSMVPIETDFCNGTATGFFTSGAVGSGITVAGTEANHPGTLWFAHLSGNANSGWRITSDGNSIMLHAGLLGEFIFKSTEGQVTTSFSRLGFQDSNGVTAPVDGAWLEIAGNGTNVTVSGKTSNNSAASQTGSTYTLALNTWVRGTVSVEAGPLVRFSLYSEAGVLLWTDTISTNIPTTAGRACGFGVVSFDTSATATTFYMIIMDYMRVSSSATFNR